MSKVMHSAEIDLLKTAILTLDQWHSVASGAGIQFNQAILQFPDTSIILFVWDPDTSDWKISTS